MMPKRPQETARTWDLCKPDKRLSQDLDLQQPSLSLSSLLSAVFTASASFYSFFALTAYHLYCIPGIGATAHTCIIVA